MAMMVDFGSVLTGGIFKFLVGDFDVPFVVHTQALKISHPLYTLATGPMEDARLGYATIEDIEPTTMRLFIEYAYTGMYRTDTEMADTATDETTQATVTSKHCTRCAHSSSGVRQRTPFCAKAACRNQYLSYGYVFCIDCGATSMDADCAYCVKCRKLHNDNLASQGLTLPSSGNGFSVRTSTGPFTVKASNFVTDITAGDIEFALRNATLHDGSKLDVLNCRLTSFRPHPVIAIVLPSKAMADAAVEFFDGKTFDGNMVSAHLVPATPVQLAFEQRKCDVGKISHQDFSKHLRFRKPFVRSSGDLLTHAKLWVFADRYLINGLKDLCLHMLHRELLVFKISESSVLVFFELLSYLYDPENKPQSDDTVNHGEESYVDELRDLVMSYAACIINELRGFLEYREILWNGGDLAADLGCLEV